MSQSFYQYVMPPASHWSLRLRRGLQLTLTDLEGGVNVGMLFYNPENVLERYNAPDTLKCQHTFKLTAGHCLYSDMGRIFCSIVEDSTGWHDTICGNSSASTVASCWGKRDYQSDRNDWRQNGHDAFLVELAKYGLGERDMAANLNLFSRVAVNAAGDLSLAAPAPAGARLSLRFEMDTLVIMHNCPHPLNNAPVYPRKPVHCAIAAAPPVSEDDACRNHCEENRRGFENNRLYQLGVA